MADNRADPPKPTTFHTLAFATRETAEQAYEAFIGQGVSPDEISLFVHAPPPPDDRRRQTNLDHDLDVGGAVGAAASALVGGAGGLLAGLGLLVVPGVGPLLAVGPVAAALTGAITGGALGGFAGSLIGAGVSEATALAAEQHLAAGRAIIALAEPAWSEQIAAMARHSAGLVSIDHP